MKRAATLLVIKGCILACVLSNTFRVTAMAQETVSATDPKPIRIGTLFSKLRAAYPEEAMRDRVAGKVGAVVEVDGNGDPLGCQVTQSSGTAALDEAACATVIEYGRFHPARDEQGRAVAGKYRLNVDFRIPPRRTDFTPHLTNLWALHRELARRYPKKALRSGQQGTVKYEVSVNKKGRASKCVITQSSGHELLDKAVCKELRFTARFQIHKTWEGKKIAGPFSGEYTYVLPKADECPLERFPNR